MLNVNNDDTPAYSNADPSCLPQGFSIPDWACLPRTTSAMASKAASAAVTRSAHGVLRRPHATRALAHPLWSLRASLLRPAPPSRGLAAQTKHVWSQEWDKISLGACPPWQHAETKMGTVLFVETGFGCTCLLIHSPFHVLAQAATTCCPCPMHGAWPHRDARVALCQVRPAW